MRRSTFALALALAACTTFSPHRVAPAQRRIVALIPSFVEDLIAIGAQRQIVGISSGSEDIAEMRNIPRVASFSSVDVERIVALHPDVVVAIPAQMRFIVPLQRMGMDVEQLPDDTYAEIFTNIGRLGAVSGREHQATAEIAHLQDVTARLRVNVGRAAHRPSVFVVLGTEPIWTAGSNSYIGTLITLAGGRDAAGNLAGAYSEYSAEALVRAQPDAIVSDPSTHLADVLNREPWRTLRAVRLHHVFIIPDASWIERPGPRYVRGLAWLIAQLRKL
ncbi:MAG TPA: helical backbone metal receptor [Candidatus Tyrphobacter sp.]